MDKKKTMKYALRARNGLYAMIILYFCNFFVSFVHVAQDMLKDSVDDLLTTNNYLHLILLLLFVILVIVIFILFKNKTETEIIQRHQFLVFSTVFFFNNSEIVYLSIAVLVFTLEMLGSGTSVDSIINSEDPDK